MGEAKRKNMQPVRTVYHHTSSLRTNLIWMSGVINLEGQSEGVFHPYLGEIITNAQMRRGMVDFPPLAWFTTETYTPNCLMTIRISGKRKDTGEVVDFRELRQVEARALLMKRLALGFPTADVPVVPWPEHPGFNTAEGRDLNETARDVGDDPTRWWVSDVPLDVMRATEVWTDRSSLDRKLYPLDKYLPEIRKMVTACRTTAGVYIPPSWLPEGQAKQLASALGLREGKL
jgi:hypothetical protein